MYCVNLSEFFCKSLCNVVECWNSQRSSCCCQSLKKRWISKMADASACLKWGVYTYLWGPYYTVECVSQPISVSDITFTKILQKLHNTWILVKLHNKHKQYTILNWYFHHGSYDGYLYISNYDKRRTHLPLQQLVILPSFWMTHFIMHQWQRSAFTAVTHRHFALIEQT